MKTTYVWQGALLGMASTVLAVGCGGAPADHGSSNQGSDSAAISAVAPAVVSGCNLTMAFDITAAENIGFIAVQNLDKMVQNSSAALNNMQLTLFQLDNQSRLVEVNKQATQVDSRLSSLFNQISKDSQYARQHNSATQLTDTHFGQYTDIDRQLASTTTTTTDQKEILNQNTTSEHFARHEVENDAASKTAAGSRSNAATANKMAADQHTALNVHGSSKEAINSNAVAANKTFAEFDEVSGGYGYGGWGGYGIDPSAFFSQLFSNFAKQSVNESAFQSHNLSESADIAARQAAATQASQDSSAFANEAARSRVATEDHVKDSVNTHLDHAVSASQTTSTDQVLRETTAITTDQRAKAAAASDNIAEARNQSSDYINQQESSHMSQSAFGFTDLESLNSNHFVLKVDIAASEREAAFQLFQGLNDSVFATSTFVEQLPGCFY